MKKIIKLVISLGVIALLGFGVWKIYFHLNMEPTRGEVKNLEQTLARSEVLTKEQAKKDLTYVYKHIKEYHPVWIKGPNDVKKQVHEQYKLEVANLREGMTVTQVWQAASRIVASLRDLHTNINVVDSHPTYIDDFAQVIEYGKPIEINGVSYEHLENTYLIQSSYERPEYAKHMLLNKIVSKDDLELLGIDTSNGVTFTFDVDGESKDFHYEFVSREKVVNSETSFVDSDHFVSYEIDTENKIGIFRLRQCANNEEYRDTLKKFFEEVSSNQIESIIVDLNNNGGGDSSVANEFITYLNVDEYDSWDCDVRMGWHLKKYHNNVYKNQKKEHVFTGKLYVLTNVQSLSAAMDFAMLIQDNHLGTIVGEASGNMPDSYGDCLQFQLPNSKLSLRVSYKVWYRIDQSKAGEPIEPDYEVDPKEALEYTYDLIRQGK